MVEEAEVVVVEVVEVDKDEVVEGGGEREVVKCTNVHFMYW